MIGAIQKPALLEIDFIRKLDLLGRRLATIFIVMAKDS